MNGRNARLVATLLLLAACSRGGGTPSPEELKLGGELFFHYCAGCHPAGGNAIYPQKTLHKMELAANGVRTVDDIVAKMRHPGRGMRQFDRATLSDREARAIASYILASFDSR